MRKIYHIILILFVCLTINSCAEIDRTSESENHLITEQIWFSENNNLAGNVLQYYDNLFTLEQISNEQDGDSNPKKENIFLVKKNSFGSREWLMDLGITDEQSGISMTFDSYDNVYITGYTRNRFESKKSSGDFTVFLAKYNSFGSRDWIKKLGKSGVEYGVRLTADSNNNIYVAGFFNVFETDTEVVSRKTLLAKYDISGNIEWTKILGSSLTYFAWDIAVDSKDNIYLTRFSENSFAQNSGWKGDILIMKFNKDGIKL